jgi:NAD(P)-dependent dehydrogenase (short-subunit alcohol dehydrogenase family)
MSSSQVAFITGVSSGIGRATAILFAQRGGKVFGSVRDARKAEAIPGVELVEMDVRDADSVQRAVDVIIGKARRIDVLVNSAGGTLLGAVEETSVAEAQALFDTNVFGTLRMTQAVLPYMRQQRSGRIINVSSVLGFLPAPYMGLYSASKHAIEGMSETLDHEVRRRRGPTASRRPSSTLRSAAGRCGERPRARLPCCGRCAASCRPAPSTGTCERPLAWADRNGAGAGGRRFSPPCGTYAP